MLGKVIILVKLILKKFGEFEIRNCIFSNKRPHSPFNFEALRCGGYCKVVVGLKKETLILKKEELFNSYYYDG